MAIPQQDADLVALLRLTGLVPGIPDHPIRRVPAIYLEHAIPVPPSLSLARANRAKLPTRAGAPASTTCTTYRRRTDHSRAGARIVETLWRVPCPWTTMGRMRDLDGEIGHMESCRHMVK